VDTTVHQYFFLFRSNVECGVVVFGVTVAGQNPAERPRKGECACDVALLWVER
jgi:hypothetical protein